MTDEVLTGGATLRLATPPHSLEVPSASLPSFQVSGIPGARIALRRGFVNDAGLALHVACVEAPSDRWAPGLEDVVLGVASGVAHKAMSERLRIEQWSVDGAVFHDQRFEQKLSGQAKRGEELVKLVGKHELGVEGEKHAVVLCTVLCDELRDHAECADLVAQTHLTGLVEAPPPSLLVKTILLGAERPREASAVMGVLGMFVVGVILARRPRPKP